MKSVSKPELRLPYAITGLSSGFLILIFFYTAVYRIAGIQFTYAGFASLHNDHMWLILVDIIPLIALLISWYIHRRRIMLESDVSERIGEELRRKSEAVKMARALIEGRFDDPVVSFPDELLSALNDLKDTLIINRQNEEKRKKDDHQRGWISEGLAMFGGILREHSEDLGELSYRLISSLVKYLNANQGGFFLVEDEPEKGKFINMHACYAYDRKKFADKRIEWGEGIIGTCILEKKTVYMSDVPASYVLVTSGLGKATPHELLVVPMIAGDEVAGVIELASFRKFLPFEISFVEQVGESFALTLSNIKNNIRTSLLLKATQAQAGDLARAEEAMRRNMEELKATQIQAAMQAEKFISFTNSVNHTLIRAEYDRNGILLYANTKFLKKLGYSGNREVEGKHISMFINEKDREWFDGIWESLAHGGKHFEGYMKHITRQGQDLWTMATYTCVRKEDGDVEMILFLAIDTTGQKKQSLDFEGQLAALNRLNLKAEFSPDGKLLSANELFKNGLKYPLKELEGRNVFDFMDRADLESFNEIWDAVIAGNPYQGEIRMHTKFDGEKWFRATWTVVNDMYNEVEKVIFLATEITNEKLMEAERRKQTDQLRKQEEQLRIASMDLRLRLEETTRGWKEKYDIAEMKIKLLGDLTDREGEIVISFDNTGLLHYINRKGAAWFGKDPKKITGLPVKTLLDNPGITYPEYLHTLFDPALPKIKSGDPVTIPAVKKKTTRFSMRLTTVEDEKSIIYNIIFLPLSFN